MCDVILMVLFNFFVVFIRFMVLCMSLWVVNFWVGSFRATSCIKSSFFLYVMICECMFIKVVVMMCRNSFVLFFVSVLLVLDVGLWLLLVINMFYKRLISASASFRDINTTTGLKVNMYFCVLRNFKCLCRGGFVILIILFSICNWLFMFFWFFDVDGAFSCGLMRKWYRYEFFINFVKY